MAREKISSDSGSEARTLESALQLRGEGREEHLRDRGLVRRAGEHPPDGGFDGPRLQRIDLAAPRREREEGAPGIVRIALPGEDPPGLEPSEDSGQRARVHAEDLREGPRRDARGASHYAHHQPLRPRDAVRRFQPFRDRLETVVDGPELLHELEDGTEVRAFLACSVRAAGVGRFRSCAQGRHRMRGERSLNSGVPAVRSRSKRTVSVLVTTAPAFSQRFSPTCRFSSVRDTIASFGTKTSKPLPTRSRTVWNTQTCDSIPTAITCRRPVASTSPATALEFAQENSIFSMGGEGSSSRMAATVGPSPFTYCSLATTGNPSRRAALMRMAAFFSIRASASGGMARASFSCTSTTRSKAVSRSRTRFAAASDGIALGSALGGGAGVETHVDTGHLPGGECALEGRPDPGGVLDVLAVSSERFDHLVVARRSEQRRGTLLGAEEVELGKADLPPGGVVADHAHDGKTEAHGGLEIHAVQAEAPVALDDEGRPRRVEELRRDREGRADAETPERSRIEPAARLREPDDLGRDGDPVSAVGDEHRIARCPRHLVELARETEVVDGDLVAGLESALLLGLARLALSQVLEPGAAGSAAGQGLAELSEDAPRVSNEPHLDGAVAPDFGGVGIDLDDLRVRGEPRAVSEPEVERRSGHHRHVGLAESVLAGLREEVGMVGRQPAAAGAVQIDRSPGAFREHGERLGRVVPPDGTARDDGGTLRPLEEAGSAGDELRIALHSRPGPIPCRKLRFVVVDAIREDVPGDLEEDRPWPPGEHRAEGASEIRRDAVGRGDAV